MTSRAFSKTTLAYNRNSDMDAIREQMKKRLEGLSAPDRPIDLKGVIPFTEAKYDRVRQRWEHFWAKVMSTEYRMIKGAKMPTETDFKLFMDYYVYTAKGRMEDQTGAITIETCKIFWRDVRSVWHRLVGQKVPTDICHSVSGYIQGELIKNYNLRDIKKPKLLLSRKDLNHLLDYLWCQPHSGELSLGNERDRIQLAFLLQVLMFTAARPGEIVESRAHHGTGDALRYKDFQLFLGRRNDGTQMFYAEFVSRNMKFRRQKINDDVRHLFFENQDQDSGSFAVCPIVTFLALCFQDSVFESVRTPEELFRLSVPPGMEQLHIRFRKEVENLHVLRIQGGPMRYSQWDNLLKKLGHGAGYATPLTSYHFRRGAANAFQKIATAAQIKQVLGHSRSDTFGNSYLSSHCGASVQSAVTQTEAPTDAIDYLQSASRLKINGTFSPLCNTDIPEDNPQYRALLDERSTLYAEMRSETPGGDIKQHPNFNEYQRLSSQMARLKAKIDNQLRHQSRLRAVEEEHDAIIQSQLRAVSEDSGDTTSSTGLGQLIYQSQVRQIDVKRDAIYRTRLRIANSMTEAKNPDIDRGNRAQLIADIIQLARPESAQSGFKEGKCHICGLGILSYISDEDRKAHISLCQLELQLQIRFSKCQWDECNAIFGISEEQTQYDSPDFLQHLEDHAEGTYSCKWKDCRHEGSDVASHLRSVHSNDGIAIKAVIDTKFPICFCGYLPGSLQDMDAHFSDHKKDISSRPSCRIMKRTAKDTHYLCPYCLGDDSKPQSKQLHTYKSLSNLHQHLTTHDMTVDFSCPHPFCRTGSTTTSIETLDDLHLHLEERHDINGWKLQMGKHDKRQRCRSWNVINLSAELSSRPQLETGSFAFKEATSTMHSTTSTEAVTSMAFTNAKKRAIPEADGGQALPRKKTKATRKPLQKKTKHSSSVPMRRSPRNHKS